MKKNEKHKFDKYWPIFPNQLGFTKHARLGVSNSSWLHQL